MALAAGARAACSVGVRMEEWRASRAIGGRGWGSELETMREAKLARFGSWACVFGCRGRRYGLLGRAASVKKQQQQQQQQQR